MKEKVCKKVIQLKAFLNEKIVKMEKFIYSEQLRQKGQ